MTITGELILNEEQFDLLKVIVQFYRKKKLVTDTILSSTGKKNSKVLEYYGFITLNNNGNYINIVPTISGIMLGEIEKDGLK